MDKKLPQKSNHKFLLLCLFLLSFVTSNAQFIFNDSTALETIPLYKYAKIASAGQNNYTLQQIIDGSSKLNFENLKSENTNIGFTHDNYWTKFSLQNNTNKEFTYFLETARPVTDLVDLYIVTTKGEITEMKSGDKLPFSERSFINRKPTFKLKIPPHESWDLYIHLKSDGEVINMPLQMHSELEFMKTSLLEQLFYGIFYGILLLAALIYLFFYFGLREKSFLYYSSYVFFIGLMQFSLDGYFYQYFAPNSGWLADHSVLIFACFSTFFLGKYAQEFLKIKLYNNFINRAFNILYLFLATLLIVVVFVPSAPEFSYPIANILGIVVLSLIIASTTTLYLKKGPIDIFFTIGIICLILGFIFFILNNFSLIPNSFFTENSPKFGTGLEVVFLSLAMANFIKRLKSEREESNKLALIRAEEMSDLKSYFLSNISHELRTPLNAIMNIIESISKEVVDENVKKNCQIIKYSSHSLLSSVNDILDFSKIQKNELQFESVEFNPSKLLSKIKESASLRAKDQGLDFQFSIADNIPWILIGDVNRLAQIVNNVLSNAIKFTKDGFVNFKIESEEKPNQKASLILTISDSGVGIPKDKMNSIFDSFTQDSITDKRKFGGLGLGLYIVKTLVEKQNGTISIDSKVNQGTICKIILDYAVAALKEVPVEISNETFDLNGKNILVVEDNAINQIVIKMMAKKWLNTSLVYVNNGQECLEVLKTQTFDIILMDLQMPIMDGYEATIAIRNGEAGSENTNIPIIAVTADVMETTKLRVKEIGMNHYLSKPLKNETLFEAIKTLSKTPSLVIIN